MLNENSSFCPAVLESVKNVRDHYKDVHNITDSNPVFDRYLQNLSSNSVVLLTSQCDFSNRFFHDNGNKAKHLVKKLLKLFDSNVNDLLIRRVGSRFIEFSIVYACLGSVYNFKDPDSIIRNFINRVSRGLGDREGEFRLVFSITNQSAVEIEGRRIFKNAFFTTGIIQGTMNDRVKKFVFLNTKKRVLVNGESGSNVYFFRFDFLKIHYLRSNLDNHMNDKIN